MSCTSSSSPVYVVSLASGVPDWSPISWIDFVRVYDRYWHPHGSPTGGWPREPPQMLGFRYGGRLQEIRPVRDWVVLSDLRDELPELRSPVVKPRIVYRLGPSIGPEHEIRTGPLWPSGRYWADLDLLRGCSTVAEAVRRTRERRDAEIRPEKATPN